MKTEWNYTSLADAYLKRPDYSSDAIDQMLKLHSSSGSFRICDIGAGVAHLTIPLASRGHQVVAVEPNDAMRANGAQRTTSLTNVKWIEGTGEDTKQDPSSFDWTTFGSSFNVTDRTRALEECFRILKPNGWFACMWNHRDLNDPVQKNIENIIKKHIPSYDYGSRREDQTAVIEGSTWFGKVKAFEGKVLHQQSVPDCIEAWRSHATLHRQAGAAFGKIIQDIEVLLSRDVPNGILQIPYTTRIWAAPVQK